MFEDFTIDIDNVNASFYNGLSIIFLITIFVYSIVGTFIVSLLITNLLVSALIFANNVKVAERNEFITFSEFQTITSPKELLSFIDVSIGFAALIVFAIAIVLFGLHYMSIKVSYRMNFKLDKRIRIGLFAISFILLLAIFLKPNVYNEYVLKFEESNTHNFNPLKRARTDGFLPSLLHTVKPTYMESPENYTKSNVQDIHDKYTNMSKDINADRTKLLSESQTILYLSETLMDPKLIPDLLLNETSIPYITDIRRNNIGGTMYSQYIGGGTANIEWSVLTSFSLEAFTQPMAITPYSDFYAGSRNHNTVLKYYTNNKVAIHPYTAHLYKRRTIYDTMGFDDFLYLNNGIEHTEKLGTHHRVSDAALNKDILRVANEDDTGLIHVLSMQNHSPYNGEIPDMEYKPEINSDVYPEEYEEELINYLQGTRASDQAIRTLINEFDESGREFNLLFYGDHYPSLFRGLEDQFSEKEIHETPWFLYMDSERSELGINYEGVSPIFFVPILLKEGNYYVTPFYALMDELLSYGVRRVGSEFIVTEDGMINDNELPVELLELIKDYRMIQYDALFGKNLLSDSFYNVH